MRFFTPKPKTDAELQAELKALCDRMSAERMGWIPDWNRYEALLKEIYKRQLTPAVKLKPL